MAGRRAEPVFAAGESGEVTEADGAGEETIVATIR
jgi:hypothetical protein